MIGTNIDISEVNTPITSNSNIYYITDLFSINLLVLLLLGLPLPTISRVIQHDENIAVVVVGAVVVAEAVVIAAVVIVVVAAAAVVDTQTSSDCSESDS